MSQFVFEKFAAPLCEGTVLTRCEMNVIAVRVGGDSGQGCVLAAFVDAYIREIFSELRFESMLERGRQCDSGGA